MTRKRREVRRDMFYTEPPARPHQPIYSKNPLPLRKPRRLSLPPNEEKIHSAIQNGDKMISVVLINNQNGSSLTLPDERFRSAIKNDEKMTSVPMINNQNVSLHLP